MTPEALAAWVRELRLAQGLPAHVANPTSLQRIADLMRPPEDDRHHRRRAS